LGEIIDFYNVQFYNQGTGTYDNAERLFNSSIARWAGSSLNEMIKSGIPASKIVLGKPATVGDGNNGWMSASDLDSAISHNYPYNGWKTGVMFWQYSSDTNGDMGNGATKFIKKAYKQENSQELL
jgi:chitinase